MADQEDIQEVESGEAVAVQPEDVQPEAPVAEEQPAESRPAGEGRADSAAPDDGDEEYDEEVVSIESMGRDETRQALYALLFASDRPMNAQRLAEAISEHMDPEIVAMLLEELREDLNKRAELPYFLKEIGGGYQLLTKPDYAPFIRRLFQIKKSKRLSKSVLETLAIIAYKQPTTRAEVEAIRGVSVSHAFEQLQERHFIKVSGVSDSPGRPKLYRTTDDFLVQFGLGSLKELPTLEELQETR